MEHARPATTETEADLVTDDGPALVPPWSQTDRFIPRVVVRPLQQLMAIEASSAAVVLFATLAALVVANSPLSDGYHHFWESHISLGLGSWSVLDLSLHHLVNDGLMTLFFLLVSLEIKREFVFGELSDPRAAALPIAAAVGGMVVPALIYVSLTLGTEQIGGWGVPMATDIAFAMAVVTALGRRVPAGARLFLLTLAVVDDLGAILVIALFYSTDLRPMWLLVALAAVVAVVWLRGQRIRSLPVYVLVGVVCWYALLQSGIHATIAGVAFGLLAPPTALLPARAFPEAARTIITRIVGRSEDGAITSMEHEENDHDLRELRRLSLDTQSPLHRWEVALAAPVAFIVVPLFAFANAGVTLPTTGAAAVLEEPVVLGVVLGLVLGKPIGIILASMALVWTGVARFPTGMGVGHLVGLALTAGIGFTVAMFVATLAFTDQQVVDLAKLGILVASAVAAVLGYAVLRLSQRPSEVP